MTLPLPPAAAAALMFSTFVFLVSGKKTVYSCASMEMVSVLHHCDKYLKPYNFISSARIAVVPHSEVFAYTYWTEPRLATCNRSPRTPSHNIV